MSGGDPVTTTQDAARPAIEAKIEQLRAKQDRMPNHWVDRRQEVADEIDGLVDAWLKVT